MSVVVDGVQKLSAQGVPIGDLIDLVPGISQQRADAIREGLRRGASSALLEALAAAPPATPEFESSDAGSPDLQNALVLKAKADALGVLRRAGVEAASAAALAGLNDVKFIPGQPITIKQVSSEGQD